MKAINPFNYGPWIDSTVRRLLAFVLVIALFLTYYKHSPGNPYQGDRHALVQNAELLTDSLKTRLTQLLGVPRVWPQ